MARAFVAAVVLMAYGVSGLVGTVQASEAKRVAGRNCTEAVVLTTPPEEAVDPFVPDRFKIKVIAGRAQVVVAILSCIEGTVGGTALEDGIASGVGAMIEAPEEHGNPEGLHFYQIAGVINDARLFAWQEALGVYGGFEKNISLDESPVGAEGNVPWDQAPYSLSVTSPDLRIAVPPDPTWWWHEGQKGLVRMQWTYANGGQSVGSGELRSPTGSIVAELVGGEVVRGVGLYLHFDFELTAQILE